MIFQALKIQLQPCIRKLYECIIQYSGPVEQRTSAATVPKNIINVNFSWYCFKIKSRTLFTMATRRLNEFDTIKSSLYNHEIIFETHVLSGRFGPPGFMIHDQDNQLVNWNNVQGGIYTHLCASASYHFHFVFTNSHCDPAVTLILV